MLICHTFVACNEVLPIRGDIHYAEPMFALVQVLEAKSNLVGEGGGGDKKTVKGAPLDQFVEVSFHKL